MPTAPAPDKPRTSDRHKARRTIAFKPAVYRKLQELARKNRRPLNWEAEIMALAHLEANGMESPPQDPPAPSASRRTKS